MGSRPGEGTCLSGAAIAPTPCDGPRSGLLRVGDQDWFRLQMIGASACIAGAYRFLWRHGCGTVRCWGDTVSVDDSPDCTAMLGKGLGAMEFVRIPAGSFLMGSPEDEESRNINERQHEVRISRDFWIGKYEVTQEEWQAVMGTNPSRFMGCARCPVERVSWGDTQEFIKKLNERESPGGHRYRLPTEAEWEYAARAGTTAAHYGELDSVAWYCDNSDKRTHPVGQKLANAWGLHDMLGNVWEWMDDWYSRYTGSEMTDPRGPATGTRRVVRGGSRHVYADRVRFAIRCSFLPGIRRGTIGFRLVRTQ